MKKQILFFVGLALVGGFIPMLDGCGSDPKLRIDPCKDKTPASARFKIGERIYNYSSGNIAETDTVIVSDTVLNEQKIVFEAKDENDSYEWRIGEDTKILTGKKVTLSFSAVSGGFALPYTLSVRLIAKKKPDTLCFPKDDGVDTVTQKFTIIERNKNPIIGNYEGYLKSNPTDIFIVNISYQQTVTDDFGNLYSTLPTFLVSNFVKGCNNHVWWWAACNMSFGYRSINFGNNSHGSEAACKRIAGWIFIDKKGIIQIPYYTLSDNINERSVTKDIFLGKLKK